MSLDTVALEVLCLVASKLPRHTIHFTVPLDSLPFELICLIVSNLPRYKDRLSLVRCNRMLHDTGIHVLYKQDSRTANYALQWLINRGFELGIQHIISRNNLDVNMAVAPRRTSINTPLLLAVGFGHTNIVELLLRNGALVNLVTDISALEYAASLGDSNMTSLLIQHGAHVDLVGAKRGLTPLQCALELGYILQNGNPYSLHWSDRDGLLNHKGEDEFIAVIQLLLAHGADPLFHDATCQSTCLHRIPNSPWKSTEKVVNLFLAAGADLNARNWEGYTPSTNAFRGDTNAQKEFVTLLLKYGADVNLQNENGEPPLGIRFENPNIWQLFLGQGANTRSHGKTGDMLISMLLRIPLRKQWKTTKQYRINNLLIEILVEHGACTDQIIDGKRPLDLRAVRKYPVLRDLMSKRTMASGKPPSKRSSKYRKHSGPIRKANKHKKTTRPPKPTRKLTSKTPPKA
ncbi:hypothetical protein N7517_001565 [Penicillium concentricum]|uniref:F-box domain-containing protein n=1 Tax=Penicillium concentricum TaxID=293559 RepID=A0A9W9STR1_9EURO|nr:uncharacterized protein N7517_001565 [Penicillium concentricum]KAJ5383654.1 hypothetical protein N7517_001565 [Penicillium concentricum]